jgi:hypothetical protein
VGWSWRLGGRWTLSFVLCCGRQVDPDEDHGGRGPGLPGRGQARALGQGAWVVLCCAVLGMMSYTLGMCV